MPAKRPAEGDPDLYYSDSPSTPPEKRLRASKDKQDMANEASADCQDLVNIEMAEAAQDEEVATHNEEDDLDNSQNHLDDEEGISPNYIDFDGNVMLVVGEDEVQFVVDAGALRRSSPVFSKLIMIPADSTIIKLKEVNPTAMEVLLNIIHTRFSRIPNKPELALLYTLVLLADEYNMTSVLRPWAKEWAKLTNEANTWKPNSGPAPIIEDLQRITCLYHLRRLPQLVDCFLVTIERTAKSTGGHLLYSSPLPNGGQQNLRWRDNLSRDSSRVVLLSHACALREEALNRLLDILGVMILSCAEDAHPATLSRHCARQCLGIIQEHLHTAGLSPLPKACDIKISYHAMYTIVSNILTDISSDIANHCQCGMAEAVMTNTRFAPKCVFSQGEIIRMNEETSELLGQNITKVFRQVFKALDSKVDEHPWMGE